MQKFANVKLICEMIGACGHRPPLFTPSTEKSAMDQDEDDQQKEPKEQRAVQSVEIGGRLLLALAEQPGPMTLKDLAAKAGLPASRAHTYLVSFGRLRLIEQDAVTGRYALGAAALQVGLSCLHQLDPLKAATPVAEALALAMDQTVAIAVWANFGPTIVRYIEASQPLHVNMRMGTVMSILGTATGRAFVAALPRQRLEQSMLGAWGDAPRRLDRSAVQDLDQEINNIKAEMQQHGVVRAVGRPIPGVNAFSAAALDHEGNAALVITALGHEDNFPADWDSDIARAVRQAAADVSLRLGYRVKAAGGP